MRRRGGARLLISPAVRDHRRPWVRLHAVARLREIGPAAESSLALYRDDPCRDARRIARGEVPFAVARGMLERVGSMTDSEVSTLRERP